MKNGYFSLKAAHLEPCQAPQVLSEFAARPACIRNTIAALFIINHTALKNTCIGF